MQTVYLSWLNFLSGINHDRFRVIAFSLGPNDKSKMRDRIKPHFEAFHDVRLMSDNEIMEISLGKRS